MAEIGSVTGQAMELAGYGPALEVRLAGLAREGFVTRMWQRDATLWSSDPDGRRLIGNSLGWMNVAEKMRAALPEIESFAAEARESGFSHCVYMGMGGSSLCPLVFERSYEPAAGGLELRVLDSTDPATVLALESAVPPERTLFFVASKSGTTAEPLAFDQYFYGRLREQYGDEAGARMAAVTDPGSKLESIARKRGYRHTFLNFADIGGRFSALSYFGLVPAVMMGIDAGSLLDRALEMSGRCRAPEAENPGVILGAAMGELALGGRDKVTLVVPGSLAALGAWLEQLIAESTGKQGRGLLPVAAEPLGAPEDYGDDRLFIHIRLTGDEDTAAGEKLAALAGAGQPLVTIDIADKLDLGGEFFRWEVATATAGVVLGINPFDQPNVQESKDNTNRLLAQVEAKGALPPEAPDLEEGNLSFMGAATARSAAAALSSFLEQARPGDYLALLAYLFESPAIDGELERIRLAVRRQSRLATTAGYGPRYLHSTGQLHKGGPDTGLFLLLTADDVQDAAIPGAAYGFSAFKNAQARGDMEALRGHDRRVMRVHLNGDTQKALAQLAYLIEAEA